MFDTSNEACDSVAIGRKNNQMFYSDLIQWIFPNALFSVVRDEIKKMIQLIEIVDHLKRRKMMHELQLVKEIRLKHQPYSPGISPSDYFLFEYLLFKLEGYQIRNKKELLGEMKLILASNLLSIPLKLFLLSIHYTTFFFDEKTFSLPV